MLQRTERAQSLLHTAVSSGQRVTHGRQLEHDPYVPHFSRFALVANDNRICVCSADSGAVVVRARIGDLDEREAPVDEAQQLSRHFRRETIVGLCHVQCGDDGESEVSTMSVVFYDDVGPLA